VWGGKKKTSNLGKEVQGAVAAGPRNAHSGNLGKPTRSRHLSKRLRGEGSRSRRVTTYSTKSGAVSLQKQAPGKISEPAAQQKFVTTQTNWLGNANYPVPFPCGGKGKSEKADDQVTPASKHNDLAEESVRKKKKPSDIASLSEVRTAHLKSLQKRGEPRRARKNPSRKDTTANRDC